MAFGMKLRNAGKLSVYQLNKAGSLAVGLSLEVSSWLKLHRHIKLSSFYILPDEPGNNEPLGLVLVPSRHLDRFVATLRKKKSET
jgi:hypothetical protein